MSSYTITPSSSVILVDTSVLADGAAAIVMLSGGSPPGRNITIRDSLGYLSSPQSIIVSTAQNVFFTDGTSSIKISQPYATLSFMSRDANTWDIINTFGFPLYDSVANVNNLTASNIVGQILNIASTVSSANLVGNSLLIGGNGQVLGTTFTSSLVVGAPSTTSFTAYISGSSYISSNVSIGGNLTVAGLSQFQSSVTIGTTLSVGSGLSVGGNLVVGGNFQTLGLGQINANSASLQSSLTVLGAAIFNSNVTINSNLVVNGNTTLGTLYASTLQINTSAGGYLQFDTGPILQGRTDIIPGQVVAAWNSPIYTPFLSTGGVQATGFTRTGILQVANTISANTVTNFIMSSTSIVNPSGSLVISSINTNSLTLSNVFTGTSLSANALNASSIVTSNQILCTSASGFISSATVYTSSLNANTISTGQVLANLILTPAVSVSSLTVAQTIIGGPAFTTFSIPSTVVQNASGSLITSSLYTTALFTSSLSLASGTLQTSCNLNINAPNVYMNVLNVSSLQGTSLQTSNLQTTQVIVGAVPSSNSGPNLSPGPNANVTYTGGPGDYLTPYFLSNVVPGGQNPLIPYNVSASFSANYPGPLPPGLQIGYTATLFWAGQANSYLNIGNGASILYGLNNSDQTVTGTLSTSVSTFQLHGNLYGNSAINIAFSYRQSSNINNIDPNAVLNFNNGVLRWNYALNGTTIQNSLNDISTRNLFYYGSLQFASDPRLKEDIVDADLKRCYDTIVCLPLRRYKYIDSYCSTFQVQDTKRLGFLATDLLPHFPKSVHASQTLFPELSTTLLSIDTSQVDMAHLGATKYLIQEVERLEALFKKRFPQ
jgi:hypothetical protein